MLVGLIDSNGEAHLRLNLFHSSDASSPVEFLLDTGFNGYLAVTSEMVERLQLKYGPVQRGMTADGRTGFFDTVDVDLEWDQRRIRLWAQVLDEPLIGTRLISGYTLNANWIPGGSVSLNSLPNT